MEKKSDKKNVFEVEIEIDSKEFNEAIDKAFDKKKKDIKLDGFRDGKVPKDVYYKRVGKESLYMDALDIVLPSAYIKALDEGNYEPIMEPKVDLLNVGPDGAKFLFTITTMPEISIKKYKGLSVKKNEVKVTKEEIEHEIEGMLNRYSELVVKDFGEVEEGNTVVIDFEGFKDGVPFDGGKAENYSLDIGSGSFIPGFEEAIVGMKKDETKDINLTFPEDYHASDLRGKDVVFKVTVHEIKERVNRELDEDFFEDLGLEGVNDKKSLEEEVEKNIKAYKENEAEEQYIEELLKKISEGTTVEIPEELIEDELHHMIHHFEDQLRMQGVSLEVFYEMTKSSEEDLKNQMREEANKHVLYRFMLDKIMKDENITVSDEEVDAKAEELAKSYNVSKDEIIKMYGGAYVLKSELEIHKVMDFLKENN